MKINVNSIKFLFTFVSVVILVYHLKNLLLFWPDIPDHIAIHFTNGEPDNWG
ncbi:DUF1648 domain-containing protein [Virgibacillus proomii]|uniref:DUF1648 domain-containing protein n=1 Tax=Virgibacillus proomii TaxID=84407 RepID=UPI001C0F669A|nr:DUF1648 domain-containing protein [Virgibacillus proomii]MBU5267245.1 DUF1648 domain-containing protein [Virgibacillus proomii]